MALRGVGVGAEKNQFCAVIAQDNRVTGQVNVNHRVENLRGLHLFPADDGR